MRNKSRTNYIEFDSGKCTACWRCIEACPKSVIGKINILIHKHAKIDRPEECKGCLICVKICKSFAFNKI